MTSSFVDSKQRRNAPASGVHGFLPRDGISPAKLLAPGRRDVEHQGGQVVAGDAQCAQRTTDGFDVSLADGRVVRARRLLVTIGLVDELPDVPGLREPWVRDVLHCEYCHSWEFWDLPVGVLSTGPWGVHQVLLFRQWTRWSTTGSPGSVWPKRTSSPRTAGGPSRLIGTGSSPRPRSCL